MKKMCMLLIVGLICFSFFACEGKNDIDKKSADVINVGMISNLGSIDDGSYNQNVWEGILRFAKEKELPRKNYSHVSSHKGDDFIINLSNFSDEKKDLIIAPGYELQKPVNKVSLKYPNQKFLLLDAVVKNSKNVLSVTFDMAEGSFLAGVATALKAKQMGIKTVGFLGGVDFFLLQNFEAGYIAGIKAIDPSIKVVVEYANDFANPTKGQKIASSMYNRGIKIIFTVAGATGNGAIKEAKNRAKAGEDVWIVGVDMDQYKDGIYEDGKSVILTSALKKLDVAVYKTLVAVSDDVFKAGHVVYSLKNDGVGLPKTNPNLKNEWMKIVERYKKDIIKGKIKVPLKPKRVL